MENQLNNKLSPELSETQREVQRLILDISTLYGELCGDSLNYQTAKDVNINGMNLKDIAREQYRQSRISFLSLMSCVFSICENDVEPEDKPDFENCVKLLESADVDKQLEDMGIIRKLKSISLRILNNSRLSCLSDRTKIDEITTEIDISEM